MRQGDWKLVAKNGGNLELYNLKEDPTEMNNLNSLQPERLRKMADSYADWAKEVGVKPVKVKPEEM